MPELEVKLRPLRAYFVSGPICYSKVTFTIYDELAVLKIRNTASEALRRNKLLSVHP